MTKLLKSIPPILDDDDEGVAEAHRRAADFDRDPSIGIPFEEVDLQFRSRRG